MKIHHCINKLLCLEANYRLQLLLGLLLYIVLILNNCFSVVFTSQLQKFYS